MINSFDRNKVGQNDEAYLGVSISMFSGSTTVVSVGSRPWSLIARSPAGSAGGGHTSQREIRPTELSIAVCWCQPLATAQPRLTFTLAEAGKEILSFCQTSPPPALLPAGTCHVTATCVAFRYGSVARSPVTSEAQ